MDTYLSIALEIVKAQASVRPMSPEDMISMMHQVADGIATADISRHPLEKITRCATVIPDTGKDRSLFRRAFDRLYE